MESEIRKLRAALARREGGRGRRLAPELRRQVATVARALRAGAGKSWFAIGREIGLPAKTVRRACAAPGFVAVEVAAGVVARDVVVVAPNGYRVEGLDVDTAVALLARLS